MDGPSAILALLALGLGSALLARRFGPRWRWVRAVARFRDPRHDPAGRHADARAEHLARLGEGASLPAEAVQAALWAESPTPAAWDAYATAARQGDLTRQVALGLTLGHLDGSPWRALIRTLPAVPTTSDDARAVEAERCLALGDLAAARDHLGRLPADHWRACRVRAVLYALDGDLERAASARHAALALAPEAARAALARQQSPTRLGVR